MFEAMSSAFIIKIGLTLLLAVIGAIWYEIRSLRKVRHEDREAITRTKADVDILLHDYKHAIDNYKELVDATLESNEELKRENGILKFMLKQAGSDAAEAILK